MTSVIGEHLPGHQYFSTMIATTTIQQHQPTREPSHYRSSRSRETIERGSSASPRHARSSQATVSRSGDRAWDRDRGWDRDCDHAAAGQTGGDREQEAGRPRVGSTSGEAVQSSSAGAANFPTPPNSSSPSARTTPAQAEVRAATQNAVGAGSAASCPLGNQEAEATIASSVQQQGQQQPSPGSDDLPMADAEGSDHVYIEPTPPPPPATAAAGQSPPAGQVIEIRDLNHIRSLARADLLTGNGPGILHDTPLQERKYDIHKMPINDIIEMVASLLSKITQTNDLQHDAIQRNVTHQQQASQNSESGSGSQMSPLSTSVLAFHGKNVPAITIHSYLSRIHRYCPTTYEVFLSLLVYFDRMTERVNDLVMRNEQARTQPADGSQPATEPVAAAPADNAMQEDREDSESVETDSDLADEDDDDEVMDGQSQGQKRRRRRSSGQVDVGRVITSSGAATVANGPATYFVVDSFNIHRLIIAGVTCASKFFSDVFYTNSRYAKVGGLPLPELNHLELQFLLLNDFRLFIPVEDLDAYATMLVEFYAREVAAAQDSQGGGLE